MMKKNIFKLALPVALLSSAALFSSPFASEFYGDESDLGNGDTSTIQLAKTNLEDIALPKCAKILDNGKTLWLDNEMVIVNYPGDEHLLESLKSAIKTDAFETITITGKKMYMGQSLMDLKDLLPQLSNLKVLNFDVYYRGDNLDPDSVWLMNNFKPTQDLTVNFLISEKSISKTFTIPKG